MMMQWIAQFMTTFLLSFGLSFSIGTAVSTHIMHKKAKIAKVANAIINPNIIDEDLISVYDVAKDAFICKFCGDILMDYYPCETCFPTKNYVRWRRLPRYMRTRSKGGPLKKNPRR
jgi:hypothetical protein